MILCYFITFLHFRWYTGGYSTTLLFLRNVGEYLYSTASAAEENSVVIIMTMPLSEQNDCVVSTVCDGDFALIEKIQNR